MLLFHVSPKRVRRDGKTTEGPARDSVDRDQKHHRRLQDSHLLSGPDSRIETVSVNKESDKKSNGYREGTKVASDNIEAPRSRSHFQVFLQDKLAFAFLYIRVSGHLIYGRKKHDV